MSKLFMAIDDTDDLESKGTGDIAQDIIDAIHRENLGECSRITRHQLYVHEDIPYTSHNSAMCFEINSEVQAIDSIRELAESVLFSESSKEADPGMCLYRVSDSTDEEALMRYGLLAKQQIFTKDDAYRLAEEQGIYLREYGGTGIGVIGALAGVGLRLYGNDGRFKGRLEMAVGTWSVESLLENQSIDSVRTVGGIKLASEEQIMISGKIKTVFLNSQSVLIVEKRGENYVNASKRILRDY
jgi:hypothetical protein